MEIDLPDDLSDEEFDNMDERALEIKIKCFDFSIKQEEDYEHGLSRKLVEVEEILQSLRSQMDDLSSQIEFESKSHTHQQESKSRSIDSRIALLLEKLVQQPPQRTIRFARETRLKNADSTQSIKPPNDRFSVLIEFYLDQPEMDLLDAPPRRVSYSVLQNTLLKSLQNDVCKYFGVTNHVLVGSRPSIGEIYVSNTDQILWLVQPEIPPHIIQHMIDTANNNFLYNISNNITSHSDIINILYDNFGTLRYIYPEKEIINKNNIYFWEILLFFIFLMLTLVIVLIKTPSVDFSVLFAAHIHLYKGTVSTQTLELQRTEYFPRQRADIQDWLIHDIGTVIFDPDSEFRNENIPVGFLRVRQQRFVENRSCARSSNPLVTLARTMSLDQELERWNAECNFLEGKYVRQITVNDLEFSLVDTCNECASPGLYTEPKFNTEKYLQQRRSLPVETVPYWWGIQSFDSGGYAIDFDFQTTDFDSFNRTLTQLSNIEIDNTLFPKIGSTGSKFELTGGLTGWINHYTKFININLITYSKSSRVWLSNDISFYIHDGKTITTDPQLIRFYLPTDKYSKLGEFIVDVIRAAIVLWVLLLGPTVKKLWKCENRLSVIISLSTFCELSIIGLFTAAFLCRIMYGYYGCLGVKEYTNTHFIYLGGVAEQLSLATSLDSCAIVVSFLRISLMIDFNIYFLTILKNSLKKLIKSYFISILLFIPLILGIAVFSQALLGNYWRDVRGFESAFLHILFGGRFVSIKSIHTIIDWQIIILHFFSDFLLFSSLIIPLFFSLFVDGYFTAQATHGAPEMGAKPPGRVVKLMKNLMKPRARKTSSSNA
eukprot:GHVL01001439.1.p1 GENE.GHVL01001439.1~~GHVL01001439.1.p1  ORF type:complete len:828 (-),score=164.17 GHVL01001439.1:16-2499(-)